MLKTLGISLLVLLILAAVATYFLARNVLPYAILQPGHQSGSTTPTEFGVTYEHLRLAVTDTLELDGFFLHARNIAKANLIMLHGVGSCKEVYVPVASELTKTGYNVLLVDMRQHGKSDGQFLTYGYYEKYDVSKMIDWLETKTPGLKTGIYGNSMGGAVALQSLAHDQRLAFGLIESTFTDLPAVANAYGRRISGLPLPRWLSDYVVRRAGVIADFDAFSVRPVDAATNITQPIQHIHGDTDANINVRHARQLFAAYASEDKQLLIVPDGDHADLWEKGGEGYREVWFGFLRRMVE